MKITALKEPAPDEFRAPLTPEGVAKLVSLGAEVSVEAGLGEFFSAADQQYIDAGATLSDRQQALNQADLLLRISKPEPADIETLKADAIHISFLDPFNEKPTLQALADRGVSAISLEMIPRTTLAQKMDAISSQANLAGYACVLHAASKLDRILPMMMTPAGTLAPAKVFIIGVGVAGLQAIATAKRLGARVQAFDTRPEVAEQVQSLGAKFLKIDLGETGSTEQGYAKELTPEQIEKQQQGMTKACAQSDVVITTAKLFGRPAPRIVNADMVAAMQPGSVIIDLAAETGGNVEGTVAGETVTSDNGVQIVGLKKFENLVPGDASRMLSANFVNLIEHFWDAESKRFTLPETDPILAGCLLTREGVIVHEQFKES